jgi:hypothetical protein
VGCCLVIERFGAWVLSYFLSPKSGEQFFGDVVNTYPTSQGVVVNNEQPLLLRLWLR